MDPSVKGNYQVYKKQSTFQQVSETTSDPFSVSSNQNSEPFYCKIRYIWNNYPHNNHDRRASSLKIISWSTEWKSLSSTRVRQSSQYQSATYQGCHMHGTKRKYTRRVHVYEPKVNEKFYKAILEYDTNAWYSYWSGKSIRKTSTIDIGIYW